MAALHHALASLRPKDYSDIDIPASALSDLAAQILVHAELIANSVPPPPNGTPYETAQRTRITPSPAACAAQLTVSEVRRPPPAQEHVSLRATWGKPLKMSDKEAATGMSVFKMAGHDRHGAWFARSGVTEGLGFTKWKRAMLREFPESLEVQGGPGEGNIRGIGGDQRLEDVVLPGIGQVQVYQLSAQFPGPTSPREFITLLITSDVCLSEASNVAGVVPRHFMVVSIPITHPDAPPRSGMVRGFYESVEMIREIPLQHGDPETNPVEWIMVTRSDPGGGIPRFMVERNVPSSIVLDAVKFLDWACAKDDVVLNKEVDTGPQSTLPTVHDSEPRHSLSITESNGITAGIGTSIADRPSPAVRRLSQRSQRVVGNGPVKQEGCMNPLRHSIDAYRPDTYKSLHHTTSSSSSSTLSSTESFASAEQFTTAPEILPAENIVVAPSITSEHSGLTQSNDNYHSREKARIEDNNGQHKERLEQAYDKQSAYLQSESRRTQKEMDKAAEKHSRNRKKQEDKFQKEIRKLEQRREKETRKLLARQQKEVEKNLLAKAQRERDEYKQRMDMMEQENRLLKEQIGELQRESTAIVARLGKTERGIEILRLVKEEDLVRRKRASSRASVSSGRSSGKPTRSGTQISMV